MLLWVRLEYTPSVEFLVPREKTTDNQFVGFHLSLPMGYMDSAPFLCMSTATIEDMANVPMGNCHHAPPHPLKKAVDTQYPKE